jgi:hypothetical protein
VCVKDAPTCLQIQAGGETRATAGESSFTTISCAFPHGYLGQQQVVAQVKPGTPPHSIEAEQRVLGAVLYDNSKWKAISDIVTEASFYRMEHREIYAAIRGILSMGSPADIVTIAEYLEMAGHLDDVGGMAYLGAIIQKSTATDHAEHYAWIIREHAAKRQLIAAIEDIKDTAGSSDIGALINCARSGLESVEAIAAGIGGRSSIDLGAIPDIAAIQIPPRPWIVVDRLLRGYVSIMAAPPGTGKTAFELASALSVATGRNLLGDEVRGQHRAWVYANEEDHNEMMRRFIAACQIHDISPSSVSDSLRLSSGYGKPLVIAKRVEATGEVVPTPVVDELIRALRDWQCASFVVDPLISTFRAEENSNSDLEAVMTQWRRIASETGCAIELPTHIPKIHDSPEAHAGNLQAVRGASSIVGAARQVYTLARMAPETARKCAIEASLATRLIRIDQAKGNYSPPAEKATWLQMRGVCLGNDPEYPDWVGALELYGEITPVENDEGNDNDSKLRVAMRSAGIATARQAPLSDVIDQVCSVGGLSQSWVRSNISRVFPMHGSGQAAAEEFSWSKEKGKMIIHRSV